MIIVVWMSWILKEKWYWIIVIGVTLVVALPLIIIWVILNLPEPLRLFATIVIILAWGVVSGYRDWRKHKMREEEKSLP
jgi:hypothetical protein